LAAEDKKARVALVCRDDETVSEVLQRLDAALDKAIGGSTLRCRRRSATDGLSARARPVLIGCAEDQPVQRSGSSSGQHPIDRRLNMNRFTLTAISHLVRNLELVAKGDTAYAPFCLVGNDYAGKDDEGAARDVVTSL
jgi:hypothetical protein